jgi:hypothetical protein
MDINKINNKIVRRNGEWKRKNNFLKRESCVEGGRLFKWGSNSIHKKRRAGRKGVSFSDKVLSGPRVVGAERGWLEKTGWTLFCYN